MLIFVSFFWLVLLSRFILPIRTRQDWRKAYSRLWASLWGKHGPAVLVKGGKLVSNPRELERFGRGVARLDFNSAIVLERRSMIDPGLRRRYNNVKEKADDKGIQFPRSHAESRGVVFIQPFETIRGYTDFRTQFRIRPGVQAYTRDGIEINNPVWVLFTLGQPPEVLDVAYEGARKPENLRVINFDDSATIAIEDGKKQRGLRVKNFVDELEERDKEEIHLFVQKHILGKFFNRVKTLSSELELNGDPEELLEGFVEDIQKLVSRFEIGNRERTAKFLDNVSNLVDQTKRNGIIDHPMIEWFAYKIGVLADYYSDEGMSTFHQIIYSLRVEEYLQELQEFSYPKDLVDYAQQRVMQFNKQHKGKDENREFILTAIRIKFIIDREIDRHIEKLKDYKSNEIEKEQLFRFKKQIDTNTAELIRADYPFTGLYNQVAKLYDCVEVATIIAAQITISDEWRFPNMGDLFEIRKTIKDIQQNLGDQEKACKLEFKRYLDLVVIYDFVTLARKELEIFRSATTKDEKANSIAACVDLVQEESKRLDRIEDRALLKQVK